MTTHRQPFVWIDPLRDVVYSQPRVSLTFRNRLTISDQALGMYAPGKSRPRDDEKVVKLFSMVVDPMRVITNPDKDASQPYIALDNRRLVSVRWNIHLRDVVGVRFLVKARLIDLDTLSKRDHWREVSKFDTGGEVIGYCDIELIGDKSDKKFTPDELNAKITADYSAANSYPGSFPLLSKDNDITEILSNYSTTSLSIREMTIPTGDSKLYRLDDASDAMLRGSVAGSDDLAKRIIVDMISGGHILWIAHNTISVSPYGMDSFIKNLGDMSSDITGRELSITTVDAENVSEMMGRPPIWWFHQSILNEWIISGKCQKGAWARDAIIRAKHSSLIDLSDLPSDTTDIITRARHYHIAKHLATIYWTTVMKSSGELYVV